MPDPLRRRATGTAVPRAALDALCDELGVERAYEAGGEPRQAPDDSVRRALAELGAPLEDGGGAAADARALRAVRLERWRRSLEPVTVAWAGSRPEVMLRLEGEREPTGLELRLELEGGATAERRLADDEVRWVEEARVAGAVFRRGVVRLASDLPYGCHTVTLRLGGQESSTRLIRAPRTTWDGPGEMARGRGGGGHAEAAAGGGTAAAGGLRPGDAGGDPSSAAGVPNNGAPDPSAAPGWRSWGAFLPLYALRTARDHGVGDLTDLAALARFTAERGGDVVGTLPLMAAFLGGGTAGEPVEPGPYAPVSRLFWNELYLDVERLPGLDGSPAARERLGSRGFLDRIASLRRGRRADPVGVMAAKREVIEAVLAEASPELRRRIDAFAARRPDALDYARFRAFGEERGAPWSVWPTRARDGELDHEALPRERVDHHLYAQWAFGEQLADLAAGEHGASLYLDLPLGCHPDGYDVWRHRSVFARGASGGAPPDALAGGGQDWGFPPLHPQRAREDGHAYLAAALETLMRVSGMLRIDHVMNLHRLFWIPTDGEPADGVYVRYPAEELWALVCLLSHRWRCEVVGEDLGTVPPDVPRAMERHRARHMWVRAFEERPPRARAVASLDTHDLPPFAAWWEEHQGDAAPPVAEELERMARSPARLVLVNLEDLWLEEEPQNVPGTTGAANWSRRARLTLEAMRGDGRVNDALARVDRARKDPDVPATEPPDSHTQAPWST